MADNVRRTSSAPHLSIHGRMAETPTASFDPRTEREMHLRVFLDLMWYFRAHKWRYLAGVSILVLVAVLNLIPPLVVGRLVDDMRRHTLTAQQLARWVALLLALGIVVYFLRYLWRQLLFGAAVRLSAQLRAQLYHHFTRMGPAFFHQRRVGDLMAHATNDIQAVEDTATDGILTLVDSISTGGVVIITMVTTINWKLTLVALLPMPFLAWATSTYGTWLHERFLLAQAAFAALNEKVQENIAGIRVVKAFGQEKSEEQAFERVSSEAMRHNIAVAKVDALYDPTIQIMVALSFFLTLGVGSWFVLRGELTLGQLTSFTMYLGQLVWPMLAFGWLFNIVERGHASYDRIRALLSVDPDIVDAPDAKDVVPSGDVRYEVCQFVYPGSTRPALQDVVFTLRQGGTLGIVGKTGAGKTTLLRLLLREFDVTEGNIWIGPWPIREVRVAGLRQAIAYVPQDHFLFSATVADNIAFGRPGAPREEIERVARLAAVHEDIVRFPEGYDTVVGERGVTLSGGQKQRISIARALLMPAEILVLDDCLSAVDARTEVEILANLRAEREGKTTLIASHRLSAVEHADLILVLDHGRIIEQGTHEELLRTGGWYADMWERQQLESLVEEGVEQGGARA